MKSKAAQSDCYECSLRLWRRRRVLRARTSTIKKENENVAVNIGIEVEKQLVALTVDLRGRFVSVAIPGANFRDRFSLASWIASWSSSGFRTLLPLTSSITSPVFKSSWRAAVLPPRILAMIIFPDSSTCTVRPWKITDTKITTCFALIWLRQIK